MHQQRSSRSFLGTSSTVQLQPSRHPKRRGQLPKSSLCLLCALLPIILRFNFHFLCTLALVLLALLSLLGRSSHDPCRWLRAILCQDLPLHECEASLFDEFLEFLLTAMVLALLSAEDWALMYSRCVGITDSSLTCDEMVVRFDGAECTEDQHDEGVAVVSVFGWVGDWHCAG
jgi:hypothetical protein